MGSKRRINVYMPDEIIARLDEFADGLGLNRSGMLCVIAKQYMDQQDMLALTALAKAQKVAQGSVGEDR